MSEWIEWKWTAEKPYPETFGTKVFVKFRDGSKNMTPFTVSEWMLCRHGSKWNRSMKDPYGIIAYRVIE